MKRPTFDFLLRTVDTVLDWRIARRQRERIPTQGRCPERDDAFRRCTRLAGHVEQHDLGAPGWVERGGSRQQPPAPCLIRAFPNCAHQDCSCADIR